MNYDSSIKKVLKVLETQNQNTIKTDNLNKFDIRLLPDNFIKNVTVIPLVVNYNIQQALGGTFDSKVTIITKTSEVLTLQVNLADYPEWAIPMSKIIPKFNVDDGWDITNPNFVFSATCTYFWKQIDKVNFQLQIFLTGQAQILPSEGIEQGKLGAGGGGLTIEVPLFLNLDLVFFNENIWQVINSNKE